MKTSAFWINLGFAVINLAFGVAFDAHFNLIASGFNGALAFVVAVDGE